MIYTELKFLPSFNRKPILNKIKSQIMPLTELEWGKQAPGS